MTILEQIKEECKKNLEKAISCGKCPAHKFCGKHFKIVPSKWSDNDIEEIEKRLADGQTT